MDNNLDIFRSVWTQLGVNEELKYCVQIIINKLLNSDSVNEYEFPSSLTSNERQYIHKYCTKLGLNTKTRRNGSNRYITAYKKNSSTIISNDSTYETSRYSENQIKALIQRFPVNEKERKDAIQGSHNDRDQRMNANNHNQFEMNRELNCTTGRLSNIIPQIPSPPPFATGREDEITVFRKSLAIWQKRNQITESIAANRIVLISGETGCGKTTEVPQFILEYCNLMKKPCRIICTEPRSLLAHSVAERVSNERMEVIGQTVGYQIRLESKVSPRTLLTFCTNGVLLRTLMGGENSLNTVTHVVIDEIQERDRFSDFLLLIMREVIGKYRNLKLILMSSDAQVSKYYSRYFGCCPIIDILESNLNVKYHYLESVLKITGFMSQSMKRYKESLETKETQKQILKQWCDEINVSKFPECSFASGDIGFNSDFSSFSPFGPIREITCETVVAERAELDVKLKIKMDSHLRNAWIEGTDYAFQQLIEFMIAEHISVDYQHSESGVTSLIVASCHNKISIVESLLSYGANINLCAPNDWNAIQWAKHFAHKGLIDLLEAFCKCSGNGSAINESNSPSVGISSEMTEDDKQILDIYKHSLIDNNGVDVELICSLIHFIITSCELLPSEQRNGSILVFLGGYDEIIKLREQILNDKKRFDANKYVLFTLYSQMPNNDLKRVFRRIPTDVRKIILATNIAESSITIDDVVFVIDSGKIKEKVYDPNTGFTTYESIWISKSSAYQRRNRANKSKFGICYHLFDRNQFNALADFQSPDINHMSIFELCLQTKLLAPMNVCISDFLSKALNPPSLQTVKKSVQLLKTIDALESNEQLTELGLHLLDLPIEPNLGKMVLYSVVLKCLDPVLTIVCSLSYRDPFIVPSSQASRKRAAFAIRKKLSANTFSDHITLLRGFQNWQKAKHEVCEKQFCEQNFISSAAMEMIVNMRAQLLGQLRASGFVRARGAGDIRDLNTNSENWAVVKAALCAGGYPHLLRVDKERNQLISQNEVNIRFDPNSVLNTCSLNSRESINKSRIKKLQSLPTDWLLFNQMTKVGKISYAQCCTLLSPITVALFAGNIRASIESYVENIMKPLNAQFGDHESDSEAEDKSERMKHVFKIDNWIYFKVEPEIASLTLQLRQKWNSLFLRRMSSPSKPMTPSDDVIVKVIVEVLSSEEQSLGLQQPVGIGQRPRPMSTDFCPPVSNIPLNSPLNKNSFQTSGRQPRVSPRTIQHFVRTSPRLPKENFQ